MSIGKYAFVFITDWFLNQVLMGNDTLFLIVRQGTIKFRMLYGVLQTVDNVKHVGRVGEVQIFKDGYAVITGVRKSTNLYIYRRSNYYW